jgi:WD40 repeat protein
VTLSKADSTIRVWNYDTGNCEIIQSYHSLQDQFKSSDASRTYLQCVALHPSGFYLAIAFIDKVKIYHLLDNEFREYRVIDQKNCHKVKFSNGGHFLVCVDFKEISVFFSFTLERLAKMPCPSPHVTNLCFNHNDTIITVVSRDGFVQKYDLLKF